MMYNYNHRPCVKSSNDHVLAVIQFQILIDWLFVQNTFLSLPKTILYLKLSFPKHWCTTHP